MNHKIKDAFHHIHASHEMKLRTNQYILQKINVEEQKEIKKKINNKINNKKYLVAFATFMIGCILVYGSYSIPVTAISIDVNPSIQLELNIFDRVIEAYGYNSDGNYVLENNDIIHMNYIDALNYLVESESMKHYFIEDTPMEIMVVSNSENKKQQMEVEVNNAPALSNKNATCHTADHQLKQQANEVGLSCGKFNAYLNVREVDPSITPEDIQQLSMQQIREKIKVDVCENTNENHEKHKGERHCNKK